MFNFFKKKNNSDLDEAFQKTLTDIQNLDDWDDPKKLERYILDSCEQIVSTTKEIEAEKKEYRVVTKYLKDVDFIEKLQGDKSKKLKSLAKSLCEFTKAENQFKIRKKIIKESDYSLIETSENEIVKTLDRLKKNEIYQSKVKKDLNNLEGEKGTIEIERDNIKRAESNSKIIGILLLGLFAISIISVFIVESVFDLDITWYFFSIILFFTVGFLVFFLWTSSLKRRRKRSLKYINRLIPMLNSSRMKYANITNAINYVYNMYNVRSYSELLLLHENYMKEKRARDSFVKNNHDLEIATERFLEYISSLGLYDSSIWESRASAIINEKDMVEVRHSLVQRRQKIREQINTNTKSVKLERDEIDKTMQEHNFFVPEILEIIHSVDKLCGLNQYKSKQGNIENS